MLIDAILRWRDVFPRLAVWAGWRNSGIEPMAVSVPELHGKRTSGPVGLARPVGGIGEIEGSRGRFPLAHDAVAGQGRERRGCPFPVVVSVSLCMIQTT